MVWRLEVGEVDGQVLVGDLILFSRNGKRNRERRVEVVGWLRREREREIPGVVHLQLQEMKPQGYIFLCFISVNQKKVFIRAKIYIDAQFMILLEGKFT